MPVPIDKPESIQVNISKRILFTHWRKSERALTKRSSFFRSSSPCQCQGEFVFGSRDGDAKCSSSTPRALIQKKSSKRILDNPKHFRQHARHKHAVSR